MKILEKKDLAKSQIEIKISVEWDEWKKHIEDAAADFSKEIKIEGFRKGKAPYDLVEKHVGKGAILDLASEKAVRESYAKVIEDEKLDVVGAPKAQILKLAEENPLEYSIVTAVMPKVKLEKWEDEIKKINAEFGKQDLSASDEDLSKELEYLANSRVQLEEVERPAQKGDSVTIDFDVKMGGVPIENGSAKNHALILGRGVFIPGFEEQVMGMLKAEQKEFELDFPAEYHEKSLAGKKAQFSVTLHSVQERKTPQVNDDFAKSLGKFASLDELKKNIREGIVEEKKAKNKEEKRAKYLEALIERTQAEIPEILAHEELHKMLHEFESQLAPSGMDLQQYLAQVGKTVEELEQQWQPQAEKRIKAALALEEIVKLKEVEVPSEEVEAEMNKTLAQYKKIKDVEKNIDLARLYNYTRGVLVNEKVFEMLEKMK